MNLDRISIQARLRSPWEALDLGFVIARHWWRPLFLSWFIPSSFVYTAMQLLTMQNSALSLLVVWWLKPLWDRGPLYIASRRLFGEEASAKDVFANLWRLYKTDIVSSLTIRRFSVTRSFDLPLSVLEKIPKDKRSERQAALHRNHASAATWLTLVCVTIEGLFVMAIFSFIALMIPQEVEIDYLNVFNNHESLITRLYYSGLLVAMALIGPFYVTAGFALYISRRIELEAWDIEIRFRHLAAVQKKKKAINHSLPALFICTVIFIAGITSSTEVYAEPSADKTQPILYLQSEQAKEAKQKMFRIIAAEQFHQKDVVRGWRLKEVEKSNDSTPDWMYKFLDFIWEILKSIGKFFSFLAWPLQYIQAFLWVSVALLIAFLAYKFRKPIGQFLSPQAPEISRETPEVMFGLDVTRESLPDDIPNSVKNLWQEEQYRAAVSLLYRALLTGLIHDYGFAFADSHTEGECVALVKARGDAKLSQYVIKLTGCWQSLAYGHLVPHWEDVKLLCENWLQVFPDE